MNRSYQRTLRCGAIALIELVLGNARPVAGQPLETRQILGPVHVGSSVAPSAASKFPSLAGFHPDLQAQTAQIGQIHIQMQDCASGMDLPPARQWLGQVSLILPAFMVTIDPPSRHARSSTDDPFVDTGYRSRLRFASDDPIHLRRDRAWRKSGWTDAMPDISPPVRSRREAAESVRGLRIQGGSLRLDSSALPVNVARGSRRSTVVLQADRTDAVQSTLGVPGGGLLQTQGVVRSSDASRGEVADETISLDQWTLPSSLESDQSSQQLDRTVAAGVTATETRGKELDRQTRTGHHDETSQTVIPRVSERASVAGARRSETVSDTIARVEVAHTVPGPAASVDTVATARIAEAESKSDIAAVHTVPSAGRSIAKPLVSGLSVEFRTPQGDVPVLTEFPAILILHNGGDEPACKVVIAYELEPGFHILGCWALNGRSSVQIDRHEVADTLQIALEDVLGKGRSAMWQLRLYFGPTVQATPQPRR